MTGREEVDFWFGDPREESEPLLPRARALDACPYCAASLVTPGGRKLVLSCPECGARLDEGAPTLRADAAVVCTCPAPYGGIGGDVYPHIAPCPKAPS